MALAISLTETAALEDPEVREAFYDRGGWVDGNALMSVDIPDDLADEILRRNWGVLVDVEVLGDDEAARLAEVEVDFDADPEAAAEDVHDALDGAGREWTHFGIYGTPESVWLIAPEESPVVGDPNV